MEHAARWTIEDTCRHAVLCWLATIDREGRPSVSPKEIWYREGDSFFIADITSAGSTRAIRSNPKVCISLLDIFRERGHKLFGVAQVIENGTARFADLVPVLQEKAGPDFPIRSVIEVHIESTAPILAPSWRFFPERDADEHIRRSQKTYGVRPR